MSAPATAPATAPQQTPAASEARAGHGRSLSRWLSVGALGAGAAGGLHIAVAVEHVEAGDLTVGFFLLTAFAQLGLAAWLLLNSFVGLRPDRRLVTLALFATVALMGLYVLAHTTSLLDAFAVPHGSDAGGHAVDGHSGVTHRPGIDPVTGVDLSDGVAISSSGAVAMAGEVAPVGHDPGTLGPWTAAAEILSVAALTALQPATWRRRTVNALLVLGGLAWALWFTGVLA
jgi:hypothetical protein